MSRLAMVSAWRMQKADVLGHPWVFLHIGLHGNEPPGVASLLLILSSGEFIALWGRHASQFTTRLKMVMGHSREENRQFTMLT